MMGYGKLDPRMLGILRAGQMRFGSGPMTAPASDLPYDPANFEQLWASIQADPRKHQDFPGFTREAMLAGGPHGTTTQNQDLIGLYNSLKKVAEGGIVDEQMLRHANTAKDFAYQMMSEGKPGYGGPEAKTAQYAYWRPHADFWEQLINAYKKKGM